MVSVLLLTTVLSGTRCNLLPAVGRRENVYGNVQLQHTGMGHADRPADEGSAGPRWYTPLSVDASLSLASTSLALRVQCLQAGSFVCSTTPPDSSAERSIIPCEVSLPSYLSSCFPLRRQCFCVIPGSLSLLATTPPSLSYAVWDLATGRCMQVLEGHSSFVLSLEFDDDRIVSASQDKTVRVWDFQVPGAPSSAVLRRQKKCTVS